MNLGSGSIWFKYIGYLRFEFTKAIIDFAELESTC